MGAGEGFLRRGVSDVGDVFEEREGGAVPEGRLRTPQDSTSARIWPTSASKRRVSWIRMWRLLTSSKGPARHWSWSAGMGVFVLVTPLILPAIEHAFDTRSG
jgi:hypothetical protein